MHIIPAGDCRITGVKIGIELELSSIPRCAYHYLPHCPFIMRPSTSPGYRSPQLDLQYHQDVHSLTQLLDNLTG